MSERQDKFASQLEAAFGNALGTCRIERGKLILEVAPANLIEVGMRLRDEFEFDMLMDVAGIDYLSFGIGEWSTETSTGEGFSRGVEKTSFGRFSFHDAPSIPRSDRPRFASVYQLLSIARNARAILRCHCEDDDFPMMPSVTKIWNSANWYEREAFDLYGIVYEGHPDLRRLLSDYGFIGHPFRKDFPLVGNVEMRFDPEQGRVVYEPTSIEPRVLVPKVIRDHHRDIDAESESESESEGGRNA